MRATSALVAAALALALLGAPAASQTDDPSPQLPSPSPAPPPTVPAADFQRLCSGHVAAVPRPDGRPGPHLQWIAYSSPTPVEDLANRHAEKLAGGAHEQGEDGCHLWRFEDSARHIWDLCPVEVQGPTSRCEAPPRGTKSILLVSVMVGGE